jgi:hypothetical protein
MEPIAVFHSDGANFGRAPATPLGGLRRVPERSEGGAAQGEIGEVVLGLVREAACQAPSDDLGGRRGAASIATLIRRTLTRTWAPILRRLSRIVPQVAAANWLCRSPIQRRVSSRT